MADDDTFDIDIYGDGGDEYQEEAQADGSSTERGADSAMQDTPNGDYNDQSFDEQDHPAPDTSLPKPPIPLAPGQKRKDGPDDRPVDPGATNALFVGELSWWTNDDEIRGWAKEAGCEDELKEVTFHEQKVNGKSKGQVYLLFETSQASTAAKHKIDHYTETGKYRTKFTVSYTNPLQNPFKTLPKDGPARNQNRANSSNFGGNNHQGGGYSNNNNFRGRGRGNNNFNAGGSGFNRGGFSGNQNNFNANQMNAGFQGSSMGGSMGGMQNFGGSSGYGGGRGGFQGGRGGNMGMRGGRGGAGGMQPQMGMGMPMPGAMMPQMGMGMPMGGGMQMPGAFQGGYNPAFGYPQPTPSVDSQWSGGPNKRPRQE